MKTIKLYISIAILLFLKSQQNSFAQVLPQDSLALVAFHNSTGGPNWINNTGWMTGPVSAWFGVTVEQNRVTELKFYTDNNLNGNIPEDIGMLEGLKTLIIGNNPNLTGNIPDSINMLISLEWLGIGNCSLIGIIPYNIGDLVNLKMLNFSDNQLSGLIPNSIGNLDSLQFLTLFNNQLTGPIPPEIGNCNKLVELRLNNNELSGTIPPSLANCNQLQTLYLSNNNLNGEIPNELLGVGSYVSLDFSNNHLTGIPPWTPVWLMLNDLAIGGNCMTFEDLEPHFVGYMWYNYYPQDSMQTIIDTLLPKGSNYNIYSGSLGEYTTYYWHHNGVYMPGTENTDTLKLINISEENEGVYTCNAQSSKCKEPNGMPMVLFRRPVTIGITVGIEDMPSSNKLIVYPNPCTDYLKIETTVQIFDGTLCLANIYGRVIKKVPWVNGTTKQIVSLDELPKGVYILALQDKKYFFMQKIVIN